MNIWLCWSHIWWLTLFLKLVCGNSICIMEFNLYCMTFENACNRAYFTLCLIYFKSLIYNNVNSWGQGEHFLFICVLWMLLCVYIKLMELNYWKNPKDTFHGFILLSCSMEHSCLLLCPHLCKTSLIPSGTAVCTPSYTWYTQCITNICN